MSLDGLGWMGVPMQLYGTQEHTCHTRHFYTLPLPFTAWVCLVGTGFRNATLGAAYCAVLLCYTAP